MTTMTIQNAFDQALRHHQAGRLPEAEQLYRQILARQPGHVDAMHYLGVIAHQAGRNDIAVAMIREAIAHRPDYAEAHCNLALALQANGQLDQAIAAFRQAITLAPNSAEAYLNLGSALQANGQIDEALAVCRQAIALAPNLPEAHSNLGSALQANGQLDEAIAAFRRAITLNPGFPVDHLNLGNALLANGQLDDALAACRQAITLAPKMPEAHHNLGNVLHAMGQIDKAIASYRQAVSLNPKLPETHRNLGNVLRDKGQLNEAIAAYRQAVAHRPDYAEAFYHLGNTLKDQGRLDEAIAAYRQAVQVKPDFSTAHSNLIFSLHYDPQCAAATIHEELLRWNTQHAGALKKFVVPHTNNRDPQRRLKIGYVSPDLRGHPVSSFMESLLAAHDPEQVETFCYADVLRPDDTTARLQKLAHHWRSIIGKDDAHAAQMIQNDQIDILVDLAGHTADNRLLLFARKPAPVQVAYLGFPGSTGLSTIDYRFTDAFADPPDKGGEFYTEELVRLRETFLCFCPPQSSPLIAPPPAAAAGFITFGSFNDLAKINIGVVRLWSQILQRLPGSRLLVKNNSLSNADAQQHLRGLFLECGIGPERLNLHGWISSSTEHLQLYRQVDIALDTFEYNGTTTTCEAMWMGVPVVTLAGQSHKGRVGLSLLFNVGLPELIAKTPEQYVEIAIKLAGDLPRLVELRRTLRQRLLQSPLMDAKHLARNVEAAYREMWRKWCNKF
jgi:protein O-GlcNAc transferase